jgi:L-fuconolactonase
LPDAPLKPIKFDVSKRCFKHQSCKRYNGTAMSQDNRSVNVTSPRIDAHHHLWRYKADEYGWINQQMGILRHDFLPDDLKPLLDRAGISGTIAVQARQTPGETEWLLQLTESATWMRGVVGWAPIAHPDFPDTLAELRRNTKLKGLRHVIHDEPDDHFILHPAFNRGIRALRDTGLVYDILIHARHLPHTLQFVDMHPDQPFVVDHCAKPLIATGQLEPWSTHMQELAKRSNVSCKLSGLVTEADWQQWTPASLEPYWRTVLEVFGPGRLLFGSDWPVALLASSYQRWIDIVTEWLAPLSEDEQQAIWGSNSSRVYSL